MNASWQDFHFLRPDWLLLLIPLLVLVYFFRRAHQQQSGWQGIIAGHLYTQMIKGRDQQRTSFLPYSIGILWMLATLALAGPTWERLPQPVYQLKAGQVVVIDMSMSMRATDVSPDRLTRAKYKAIDLVKTINEGETGLVAYAGDAYTISPLTADYRNLASLLPSLSPEIMPIAGSDPLTGFETAAQLLNNAGYQQGNIFWITDGVERQQMSELRTFLSESPYSLNILAVGTQDGAPIKQTNGELLKDISGQIVIPRLDEDRLQSLAQAGNGAYHVIMPDDQDVQALAAVLNNASSDAADQPSEQQTKGDKWQELGPYLILLCLPLLVVLFRRGVLLCLFVLVYFTSPPPAMAQNTDAERSLSWWEKAFNNADQQGELLYEDEAYAQAAETFESAALKAAAQYKAGNYEQASELFGQVDTADAHYNRGNALAHLQQYDEALAAYDKSLALNPDNQDAAENKALIEKLLEQQKQEQQDQQQSEQDKQDEQQQNNNDQQNSQQSGSPSEQDQSGSNQQDSEQQQDGTPSDNAEEPSQKNPQSQSDDNRSQSESESDPEAQQNDSGENQKEKDGADDESTSGQRANQEASSPADEEARAAGQAELSDAEKENLQRLENLKRRIPDDPAFLLKRKMQLEAQRRQQRRPPTNRSDW